MNARLLITRQNADPAALLHPSQILFRLLHVCVDLVHALLNAVQLFCKTSSRKSAVVQVCDSNNIITLTHFTSHFCTKIDRSFYWMLIWIIVQEINNESVCTLTLKWDCQNKTWLQKRRGNSLKLLSLKKKLLSTNFTW